MRKPLLLVYFSFLFSVLYAQVPNLTKEEKAALDSMFANDAFFKAMNEQADSSYVELSVGVSNAVFSVKNNTLNAEQATTSKLYYTPGISYFHKSGVGISASCYIANDDGGLKVFQYAFTPSYSYTSKKINWAVSYTRYITGANTGFEVNPFKNDFYGSVSLRKPWLKPMLAVGYSIGRYKEYFDSVVTFTQIPRTITIRDTITTTLSSFSLNLSVSHTWSFRNLLVKHDELELQPAFLLNGSNQKIVINHSGSLGRRRPVVQNLLKAAYGDGRYKERFSLQSLACMINVSYGLGRWMFQPQVYLDYYLHNTTSQKFSAIYSFSISYAF